MKIEKMFLDKRDIYVTMINYHYLNGSEINTIQYLTNIYERRLVFKLFGPYPSRFHIGVISLKHENK